MAQDTREQQTSFRALIVSLLADFASSSGAHIDRQIERALERVGEFVDADHTFVIQLSTDRTHWSVTHEWCRPGVSSQRGRHQDVPLGTYDWSERQLLRGELVHFNSLDDTPLEAKAVRELWASLGFKSSVQLPLRMQGGSIAGCIAVNSVHQQMCWVEDDITDFQLLGEVIANVLERRRAEHETQASVALFRATFEQAPVGILDLDLSGMVRGANQRICEMLACSEAQLTGRLFRDLAHPADASAASRTLEQVLGRTEAVRGLEQRFARSDGTIVWGNVTVSLVRDGSGQARKLMAVIEDITARKQADDVFDAIPDLIFVLDQQRRIVRTNKAAADRLGCDRAAILGQVCHQVMHGTLEPLESCPHTQMLKEGKACQFETYEPRLGGNYLVSCRPLTNSAGEIVGSVHVARDVTELRESEAALRRAHEQLQQRRALSVAASLDCVWEWDLGKDMVEYSPQFAELLGYAPEQVASSLDFFRALLHVDDVEPLWQAILRHLREGMPYDVECRLRTREGDYRWFRSRGQAQRNEAGEAVWMAGSLQDIHQRKLAEMELRGALQEIERLSQRLQAENIYLQEELTALSGFDEIVGRSELLLSTLAKIEQVAVTNAGVLLLGETGTGKELLARAIHSHSPRGHRPLVKVNLAALPSSLIESELFGHVKGAFTGAVSDKIGRFELADGGTLFLDEIGELEPELQTKLLRVLQEGEFERIGSSQTLTVDVRLVAATNRDLRQAMEKGRFRPDLYYRLAVFPVEIPPLRMRREDIPLLVWHFITKKQGRLGREIDTVPRKAMNALIAYDWPGNVRELENVIERAMILSSGSTLLLEESLIPTPSSSSGSMGRSPEPLSRTHVLSVLEACHWKIKGAGNAAERLGLNPSTLRYRMKVLGIKRPQVDG